MSHHSWLIISQSHIPQIQNIGVCQRKTDSVANGQTCVQRIFLPVYVWNIVIEKYPYWKYAEYAEYAEFTDYVVQCPHSISRTWLAQ